MQRLQWAIIMWVSEWVSCRRGRRVRTTRRDRGTSFRCSFRPKELNSETASREGKRVDPEPENVRESSFHKDGVLPRDEWTRGGCVTGTGKQGRGDVKNKT